MSETVQSIPETQYAVQLVGPSQLRLNKEKEVYKPGPTQLLAKVEAVGLCFSDLKLLKQFTAHARKSEILSGLSKEVLAEIPSYAAGEKPTVPGHEAVCQIVAVGDQVKRHKVGERVLVQADYRELKTANANGAFGYNFEGGLEEYALLDERVVIDPVSDERFLIPVTDELSASAVALVEPWACVEDSYVTAERNCIKAGGTLLVVAEEGCEIKGLAEAMPEGKPAKILASCDDTQKQALEALGVEVQYVCCLGKVDEISCDDIVYFGANKDTVEQLDAKLVNCGILNIVTGGKTFGQGVSLDVGRTHYGMIRFTGTMSDSAADGYKHIPQTGELRDGDKVVVIGAGGPMGQMHVIRNICAGKKDLEIVCTDFDSQRLEGLSEKADVLAESNGVKLRMVNTQETKIEEKFSYFGLMAPVAQLVPQAIKDSSDGCLINIFAGIPAGTRTEIDLDLYIQNHCWMFGTSGSTIEDMKIVYRKVESGQLDTNCSVDAVSGMEGAIDGIAAVENRTLAGKILVYPELHDMPLIPLTEIDKHYPTVAAKLQNGMWTKAAEEELLKVAK